MLAIHIRMSVCLSALSLGLEKSIFKGNIFLKIHFYYVTKPLYKTTDFVNQGHGANENNMFRTTMPTYHNYMQILIFLCFRIVLKKQSNFTMLRTCIFY